VLALIKRSVFANANKNSSAPQIFLILCGYTVITSVYTWLLFDTRNMLIRFALCLAMIAIYIITERSPLSVTWTAFVSPTLMLAVLVFGAIYFKGDSLLFIYMCCITLVSLTFFDLRGLAAHIAVVSAGQLVVMFVFKINLLGAGFTMVYNLISFIACLALNILAYSFCSFCVKLFRDLTAAKNEAELASRAKGTFLATMSHEIRTPLNAVIGLTEAELRKELPDAQRSTLRKIHSSGALLLGIINDILDISKIESGKFDLVNDEYNFADMLYDTVGLNSVRIGTKPITFVLSVEDTIPRRLYGDELRVKQLLNNLLSNAFKYTPDGTVTLTASRTLDGGDALLRFSVADTGIGISPEDVKKLFSEYSQVNTRSNHNIEGTGLGLSICKGLVDIMGGEISVQSEFGEGSTFTVSVRQKIVDDTPIGAATAAELISFTYVPEDNDTALDYTQMPNGSVLVVDDIEINLEVASCCLEPYGLRIDCVDNGREAVRMVERADVIYDVIFMDHMMPIMDGIETARAIRSLDSDYAREVPIIALTANAITGSDKMFAENGFQGFLAKPIEPLKLDAVLKKWIPA
jgi:signal transduction histidine kinase/CheY-like chemotaxis protein